jgi:glycosyltransferase involved in cell wall biosynthesis
MRIAQIVWSLDVGGQERLILGLSRELLRRGHDVHVVTLREGGTLRGEFQGIPILDVPHGEGFEPRLTLRLLRALRRIAPDVVHTHNASPLIYAVPAARAALVKTVVHTKHGSAPYTKRALWLARATARTVSAFVAVSDETAAVARRDERPAAGRLRVVPNGIPLAQFARDLEARAAVRAELGIPSDAVVIGGVGRLVPEKDFPLLVRAAGPLLGERVRLVIAGDGPASAQVAAAVREAPGAAPFVTLTGIRHDVPRLLSAFDVFCLSSWTEGLPLVLPEAMACGLPIVATRVGGVSGIVPPELGTLVDHGDDEGLRAALAELVGDDAARARMGERARTYAHARFSLERVATDYERLY